LVQAEKGRDMGRVIKKVSEEYIESKTDRKYQLEILKKAEKSIIISLL
jgi:hypothetical protein